MLVFFLDDFFYTMNGNKVSFLSSYSGFSLSFVWWQNIHLLKMDHNVARRVKEWERTAFWYENVNFSSSFCLLASVNFVVTFMNILFSSFFCSFMFFKTQREIFRYRKCHWIDNLFIYLFFQDEILLAAYLAN